MSVKFISQAWDTPCPTSTSKLVLVALADHADIDGQCFPSTGRLAERCGVSSKTVKRALAELDAAGIVSKVARRRRANGTLGTWLYRINQGTTLSSGPGDIDGIGQGTPMSSRPGDTHVPAEPSYSEPSYEPPPPSENQPNREPTHAERRGVVLEQEYIKQRATMTAPVRSEQGLKRTMLERIESEHGDEIDRILAEYPTAPYDVVASAAIHGDKHSLAHHQRTPTCVSSSSGVG